MRGAYSLGVEDVLQMLGRKASQLAQSLQSDALQDMGVPSRTLREGKQPLALAQDPSQ